MICDWDEVPWAPHELGELRFERQSLSEAAGSARISLSRYRIYPGCRQMPLHAHIDEEEIFIVLAGSGLSWQEGATYEIGPGDTLVHRAGGEAHTLLAGDDAALDVLAFASGSPTGLTVLPRAGVTWVGSRWLPADAPHPFRAEPALADDLPPRAERPPSIVALDSVTPQAQEHGRVQRTRRALADAAGSVLSGLQHVAVAPGKRSSTRHCHSQEEELFVVLDGAGVVLLGDEQRQVSRGSVVARPAGTGVAHAFQAGPDGLALLAYGTRDSADLCWYPDSQKIAFRGLKLIARVQPLDYWDGEQ